MELYFSLPGVLCELWKNILIFRGNFDHASMTQQVRFSMVIEKKEKIAVSCPKEPFMSLFCHNYSKFEENVLENVNRICCVIETRPCLLLVMNLMYIVHCMLLRFNICNIWLNIYVAVLCRNDFYFAPETDQTCVQSLSSGAFPWAFLCGISNLMNNNRSPFRFLGLTKYKVSKELLYWLLNIDRQRYFEWT